MGTSAAALDAALAQDRLARLRTAADRAGVSAVVVSPGSDLRYLLGVGGSSFERLTCLVVPTDGAPPVFVAPALEYAGLAGLGLGDLGLDVRTWVDGEDPYELALAGTDTGRVAVSDLTPVLHAFRLRAAGAAHQVLAGPVLRDLRMRKDPAELEQLRLAGAAIDRVHARVGQWLRPGRTEAEVGADIAAAIVQEGHAVAEFVIVGSGPNAASPHHSLSDRVIGRGELVVVDIGGPLLSGYNSDSTRTYAAGLAPSSEVASVYAALQAAQQAAVDVVRPGVTCEAIDEAARAVLREAGLDQYFIHRTGHGIGLDVHEEPYIVAGNDLPVEPGMTFSIEPGVYLPGEWGARIEDIVAVTDTGVERFNTRPHDLLVI
ncbi:MAG: Xaa-Pro peptidase family protein [Intrasporangium sp.]|uniref:M24 family metallopeptidase n=1 Tax=Intrasporangium sp. TaxID=1925024 RepID=UPI0026498856|nr:Xaa-Pro peptidase family protein [Intrasporangium sp.]MDN5796096.1 Xaa-Pro peptidase family protein [Intrasporangium sp.]